MTAKNGCNKPIVRNKDTLDFNRIGGLTDHIQLLREIIILPLVYSNLYSHFNIKAPRGILFYGPPGTGKTLVAGALANELSKEGQGKVQFFSRKGADVLDKYVGESERKLQELFGRAAKHRPSIIFFDELDGLAPPRSQKNDQVHSSIVATLLALMDGLSNMPGVIVIGATNRVDAIDPALRRPGRFDRELYFSIPCTAARKEILQIHIRTWPQKPTPEFLSYLAQITAGFTGSDLQALCSDAFLCCVKRSYPSINGANLGNKVNIDKRQIKVQECDFLVAKRNITPWTQRCPYTMKKLSECLKPLLQRQVNNILSKLGVVWPHFTNPKQKLLPAVERHIGRVLLLGSSGRGLHIHIVPAVLQALEHLPLEVIDASSVAEKAIPNQYNIPSVLLLSRVHDWWNSIDDSFRSSLTASLQDMHPSSPLLIICTSDCYTNMPGNLQHYFSNNSALVIHIENPTRNERVEFFKPLFFGKTMSVQEVWHNCDEARKKQLENSDQGTRSSLKREHIASTSKTSTQSQHRHSKRASRSSSASSENFSTSPTPKRARLTEESSITSSLSLHSLPRPVEENLDKGRNSSDEVIILDTGELTPPIKTLHIGGGAGSKSSLKENVLQSSPQRVNTRGRPKSRLKNTCRSKSKSCGAKLYTFTTPLTDLLNTTNFVQNFKQKNFSNGQEHYGTKTRNNCDIYDLKKILGSNISTVKDLFSRVMHVTSENNTVNQLELLYDTILASIRVNKYDFGNLLQVSYLSNFGGKDVTTQTNKILKHVMTNDVAKCYSFYGSRLNKKSFAELKLNIAVVRAVQTTNQKATVEEIHAAVKTWLKHAPQRLNLAEAKSLKKRQSAVE